MTEELEEIKVILVGDSGVGKTNLIKTCVGLEFEDNAKATVSGSFLEKIIDVDGTKYSLNLWDTAGQEAYRSVTKLFFKDSEIVIFVYDITNYESFKSLEEWINISKEIIKDKFIYGIVGNKNDLYLHSQVKEEEAKKFAEIKNAKYKIVSAKTDIQSFSDFLTELVKEYKCSDKKINKSIIKLNTYENEDKEKTKCFWCVRIK